jgi:hypothetical protein
VDHPKPCRFDTHNVSIATSSFGNFVFWDYGVIPELHITGDADLYLHGEDSL